MSTRINSVTLSKSIQTASGDWVKCEVSASNFESYGEAVKDLVGDIEYTLLEMQDTPMPATPEADEAAAEIEAETEAEKKAEAKKAKAKEKKKEKAEKKSKTTKTKEVAYDRENDTLKKKFAEVLTNVLPSWKTDCKPKAGELSKGLNGMAMLDSDGNVLPSFEEAVKTGLAEYLPNEEEDGL